MAVLQRWFAERSLPWLVVRLTDPPAQRAGFEVSKVIVPGLVPIVPMRSEVFCFRRIEG
jgi:hypothetical protein